MQITILSVIQIAFALGLLILGRKLYWLFVGAVGFISVTEMVTANFTTQPEWLILLIGVAVGILGAVLAIFFRMAGIGLAGFLGGGYVLMAVSQWLGIGNPTVTLILTGIGAIGGLLLILLLFDWALIIISSLTGALLLAQLAPIQGRFSWVSWLVIAILAAGGILIQSREVVSTNS